MVDTFVYWLGIGFEMVDIGQVHKVDQELQTADQPGIDLDKDLKSEKMKKVIIKIM